MKHIPPTIEYACAVESCDMELAMWEAVEWQEKTLPRPNLWNNWHKNQTEFNSTSEMVVGQWLVLVGFTHD